MYLTLTLFFQFWSVPVTWIFRISSVRATGRSYVHLQCPPPPPTRPPSPPKKQTPNKKKERKEEKKERKKETNKQTKQNKTKQNRLTLYTRRKSFNKFICTYHACRHHWVLPFNNNMMALTLAEGHRVNWLGWNSIWFWSSSTWTSRRYFRIIWL